MFFQKLISHLVLTSILLSSSNLIWADVIEAEPDDEKVYEQDKLDEEVQKSPSLAPTATKQTPTATKQTTTVSGTVKNQVPMDMALPEFSQTEKGRKYIKQNGKPRVHDAWGNPPEKNVFTDLIKKEDAKKKKTKPKLKYPPRRSLKKTSFIFKILDFFIGSAHALDDAHPTIPGIINCRANNNVQGYFKAYFEDMALNSGAGYAHPVKGPARRQAICEVLRDLAQIIKLDTSTTPRTPDIIFKGNLPADFASNALAAATPVFGLAQTASGADNGSLHKHLVTREDPTPGAGSFDAYVYTNWNICWDVDATTCANQFIFKTVITHEILHAMGFLGSLAPVVSATGTGTNHSTFNEFSYGQASAQGSAINAFFNFTQPLSPVVSAPNGSPSAWFINNLGVYQGRSNYVGANPDGVRALFNPTSWTPGSSLSHFDQVRAGTSYMMHPSIGPGETRTIHLHEKEVLCHLGYEVFGLCDGPTPYAKDDFAQAQQFGGNCLSFMTNDMSFTGSNNNLKLHQYEVLPQNLSVNVSFHQNSGCTDSAVTNLSLAKFIKINTSQAVSVKYQVKDIVSNRISQPARIVSASCSTVGDEYVCNGDFELGAQDGYPLGICHNSAFNAGPTTAIPFWSGIAGSPDFIFKNRPNYPNDLCNFPTTYNTYAFMGPSLGTLDIDMPNDGQYAALIATGEDVRETIYTKLKAPLSLGQWYTVSFNTFVHYWMPPAGYPTEFNIKAGLTATPITFNWEDPLIPATGYLLAVEEPIPVSITGQANWTPVSWDFYADQPYQYLHLHYAQFAGVMGLPVIGYVDNISIKKANFNSISGVVYNDLNANGVKDPGEQGINGLTVKLFNSATATQAIQTQTTANSSGANQVAGSFSFPSLDYLNYYYVVISPENSVASITQPSTNNTYLPGYQRTLRIPFSNGGHLTDQNFGVLLTGQASPNQPQSGPCCKIKPNANPLIDCSDPFWNLGNTSIEFGRNRCVQVNAGNSCYWDTTDPKCCYPGAQGCGSTAGTICAPPSVSLAYPYSALNVSIPGYQDLLKKCMAQAEASGNPNYNCCVTLPLALTATAKPSCNLKANSIDLNVVGGTAPYTYSWSSGQTTQDLSNINSGNYTVTVTDANGLTGTLTVNVPATGPVVITGSVSPATSPNFNNGSINISVSPTANYNFTWLKSGASYPGNTTEDQSNLTAGSYSVTAINQFGCKATKSFTISKKIIITKPGVPKETSKIP